MKKILRHRILWMLMLLCCCMTAGAQAFKGGEVLDYKMYFNWKFVWVNAGTATMKIDETNYQGRQAYRCALTTRSSQKIDKYFRMRDTLLCYTTLDYKPLYYRKGASEGSRYYVDELLYNYSNGLNLTMKELTSSGEHLEKKHTSKTYIYDMLSIFLKARNYSPEGWQEGYTILFPIASGRKVITAKLRYDGKQNVKAENGKKYNCLKLTYIETEDKKDREIVRFFVTNDKRHIPVRIDLFLNFGTAKAFLKTDI